MNDKGFAAVLPIVGIVILLLAGFFVYKANIKPNLPTNSSQPQSNIYNPNSTPNNLMKVTNQEGVKTLHEELFLKTYKGQDYKLEWEEASSTGVLVGSTKLINYNKATDHKTVVKEYDPSENKYALEGKYLSIITSPPNSSKVFLSQGHDGTDGITKILLDIETGAINYSYMWQNESGYNCNELPFNNATQEAMLYSCKDSKSDIESFYVYNLNTEQNKKMVTLNSNQTFECKRQEAYETPLIYQYLESNSVQVSICDTSKTVIAKETIIF